MMLDFWVWQWMSKYDTRGVWLDEGMEWKISARYPQGRLRYGYGMENERTIPTRQAKIWVWNGK